MTDDCWAGVDVGTKSLRVRILDTAGMVVGRGAAPLASQRERGRHEQDPEGWWRALGDAFRQALADPAASGSLADRIRAIAICSTSGTFLLADTDGRPRTPAVMYDDARARIEAAEVAGMQPAVALQHRDHDRPRRHVLAKRGVKWPLLMHFVEGLGLRLRQPDQP